MRVVPRSSFEVAKLDAVPGLRANASTAKKPTIPAYPTRSQRRSAAEQRRGCGDPATMLTASHPPCRRRCRTPWSPDRLDHHANDAQFAAGRRGHDRDFCPGRDVAVCWGVMNVDGVSGRLAVGYSVRAVWPSALIAACSLAAASSAIACSAPGSPVTWIIIWGSIASTSTVSP